VRRRIACVVIVAVSLVVAGGPVAALVIGQPAPEITGSPWINSAPLTLAALRGRVVLIDFWTYG
jgi:hypothetical protein